MAVRIRERRAARALTQSAWAAPCGLRRTFVEAVERGERNVSVLNLRVIARVLKIPLAKLFADTRAKQGTAERG